MSLDRQSIEKRDFPIGRRGYEPEAVDAHLARIAAQVDELQQQSRRRTGDSLASAASDQVRLIVQAAESSAAEIEQGARDEAARIRDEAAGDAERTRHEAIEKASDHVGRVDEATVLMLQRVDAMESELNALVESLRTGSNRLQADMSLLQGNMSELYDAAGGSAPAAAPAPAAAAPAASEPADPEPEAVAAPEPPAAETEVVEVVEIVEIEEVEITASAPSGADDAEGARLVALDMALGGASREETDRYLAEHYDLTDRAGLLEEVYATVEG